MSHADQSALWLGVLSYPERCISPSITFYLASGLSDCRKAMEGRLPVRWFEGSSHGCKQNRPLSRRGRWEFLPYLTDEPRKARKSVFFSFPFFLLSFPPAYLLGPILSHVRLPDYQDLPTFHRIAPRKKKKKSKQTGWPLFGSALSHSINRPSALTGRKRGTNKSQDSRCDVICQGLEVDVATCPLGIAFQRHYFSPMCVEGRFHLLKIRPPASHIHERLTAKAPGLLPGRVAE